MNNNPLRNENTPKYFLQRAWIYSKEMFPVFIYIPYVVALYFCVNIVIQILNSPAFIAAKTACWGEGTTQQMLDALHAAGAQVVFNSTSFAGVVSAFFVMLMMRTFDDLKDFERGFIRAETVSYQGLVNSGTMSAAKEKGLVRSEGKEYIVQEGDVLLFRFNV